MLRSENVLNKPLFSRLKNGCSVGRISKKHRARKKEFLRIINNQEYNSYISVSLAEKLIREINETASYNEQTAEFVEEIRKKLYLLHDYNTHVAKVAYTYPTSKEIYELLGKYVALESEVLYKNEYTFKYEKMVEDRVFSTILSFLKETFSTEYDCLNDEKKHVFDEALKIFVSYVDVKYTHDEDKFPARIVKNILDNLGLIKKSTANPSGHLDLSNPSLIRLKESLKDSDYGSDDDGQETASVSSESSFRAMLSRRTFEKESKKDIPNYNVDICNAKSTDTLKDTSNSLVSNDSNDIRDVLVNATNESSQSSSKESQNSEKTNSGLESLCNSSARQSLPNFPTSNEVFSSISNNDRNFFFDFNVDEDIESIAWSESKPQLRQNPTSSNKINYQSKTRGNKAGDKRNIEYRIHDTIAIVSTDDEEDDFEDNLTDFDALEFRLEEQKRKQSLLNNLKTISLEELRQDINKTNQLDGNKSDTAFVSFEELSPIHLDGAVPFKEESSDEYIGQNIARNINSLELNDSCKTMMPENHTEKCIGIDTINAELVIDISSSDEDEQTHMILKEKTITNDIDVNEVNQENHSIHNTRKQITTSFMTNEFTTLESLSLIHTDIDVEKKRSLLTKGKIFCRSLDELTTKGNLTESYEDRHVLRTPEKSSKSNKFVGDLVHKSTGKTSLAPSLLIDLCSAEKYVENNSHSLDSSESGPSNIFKDTNKGSTEMEIILDRMDNIKKVPHNENLESFNIRNEELISDFEEPPEKSMTDNNLDHLTSSKLFSYIEQCIPLQNNELDVTTEETENSKNIAKNLLLDENRIEVETSSVLVNDGKNSMKGDIVETIIDCDEYDDLNNKAVHSSLTPPLIKSELLVGDNNPLEVGSLVICEEVSDLSQPLNKIIECQVESTSSSFINNEEKNSDKETNIRRNLIEIEKQEINKTTLENSNIHILRTGVINSTSVLSSSHEERRNTDITSLSALATHENEMIEVLKKQNCSRYESSSFSVQNADILSNHQKIISTLSSPQLKSSGNVDKLSEIDIIRSDSTSTINFQDDIIGNLLIDENPHISSFSSENEANSENNLEVIKNNKGVNFDEAELKANSELLVTENYSCEEFNNEANASENEINEEKIIGIVKDSTHKKIIEKKNSVFDAFQYTEVEHASSDSSYPENKIRSTILTKEVRNFEIINEISSCFDLKHNVNENLIKKVEKLPIISIHSNVIEKSGFITESNEVTNENKVSQEQCGKFEGTRSTDETEEHSEKLISSSNYLIKEKHPDYVEGDRSQEKILYDEKGIKKKSVVPCETERFDECEKYSSKIKVIDNVIVSVETPILNKSGEYEVIPLNNEAKVPVSIQPESQHIMDSLVKVDGKKCVQKLPLPAMTKNRSSDSHNVVGNLGKVMLLMTQTEPRRLKRNISFTSPIKMNDPCTMFENVPNNSSVECDTQKQQFNIDILASVASKQKPLRVDITQNYENSAATPSDINKQSPSIISKDERSSPNDKIKCSPCDSSLINMISDTSLHTNDVQSNSLPLKSKHKKTKSISKSHKSGRKKDSYATTSTASKKAINKNVKQKRHENSQKEELKPNKKSITRKPSLSKDQKIKAIKSTKKSSRIKQRVSKEIILENFDSDDSLPLNIRMKKIESSPVDCTIIKSSKKDPPSRNRSRSRNRIPKDEGYSKNKDAIFQKKNEEKQKNVECKNELETKTSITLDKSDKNITISPVKEDRSRRIVHFKKAMLESISQDLDENVNKNSNINVQEKKLNPLISNDNKKGSDSSSMSSHCGGIVNNPFPSALTAINNIEPELWNTAPEVIVEYKEILNNQDIFSTNIDCNIMKTSNNSIPEPHSDSGNNSDNFEQNFMNTYKSSFSINVIERKQKTDEAIDISSTDSGKNIQCVADPSLISNLVPSAVTPELIKKKITTNDNLNEKICPILNIGMADSSLLPKNSEKESTESDNYIEDNIKTIESQNSLDGKIQLHLSNTENDLMESPSTKSQEKSKLKTNSKNKRKNFGSDVPLFVETVQSCQEKMSEFEEKVQKASASLKTCDLKVSLVLPITPSKNKNNELVKGDIKLHSSSSSELNTKDTSSQSKIRRKTRNKSKSQENLKKAEYIKSTIENVELKSLKYISSPLNENDQDEIFQSSQNFEEKQSGKQKRIPKEDKSITSSPNIMVKENLKTRKKKTRTLYDTKQELSSEKSSLKIKTMSVDEKEKTDKKLLINEKKVNECVEGQGSNINEIRHQEIDSKKVKDENTSNPCILLDKISTPKEKYDANSGEKSRRSKRKRSESEISEKILDQTKKENNVSSEDTDEVITNIKKNLSNEKNLGDSSKTVSSSKKKVFSKYSNRRKPCSKMIQEKLNIETELVKQKIGKSITLQKVSKKILTNSPEINDLSLQLDEISFIKKDLTSHNQKTFKNSFEGNMCMLNLARETGSGSDIISSEINLENSDRNKGNNLYKRVQPSSQLDEVNISKDWNVGQESVVEMKIKEGNNLFEKKSRKENRESENEFKYLSCEVDKESEVVSFEGDTEIFYSVKDSSEYSVEINVDRKFSAEDVETSKIINNLCEKLEDVTIKLSKSDEKVEKNQMSKVKKQSQELRSHKNAPSKFIKIEKNYPSTNESQQKTINEDLSTNNEIELQKYRLASLSNKKDELMSNSELFPKVDGYEDLAVESIIETEIQVPAPSFSIDKSIILPCSAKVLLKADDHSENVYNDDLVASEFAPINDKKNESIDSEILIKTDDHLEHVKKDFTADNTIETKIQVTEQVSLSDINIILTKNSEIPVSEVDLKSLNGDESTAYPGILLSDDHSGDAIIEDFTADEKNKSTGDSDVLSKSDEKVEDMIHENLGSNIETEIQESEVVPRSDQYAKLEGSSEPIVELDVQFVTDSEEDLRLESRIENHIHGSELVHPNDKEDKSTDNSEVLSKSDIHLEIFPVGNNIKAEIQILKPVSLCIKRDKPTKDTELLPKLEDPLVGVIIKDFPGDNINKGENQSKAVSTSYEKYNSTSDYEELQKSDDYVKDDVIEDFSIDINIEAKIQVSEAVSLCDEKDEITKDTEIAHKTDDHLEGIIIEDIPSNYINENEIQIKAISPSYKKDESKSDSEALQKSDDNVEEVIIKDFSVGNNIEARIQVTETVSLCDEKDKTKDTEILPKSDDHSDSEDTHGDNINENEIRSEDISPSYEKDNSTGNSEVLQTLDKIVEDIIIEDFSIGNNDEIKIQVSEAVSLCDQKDETTKDTEILPKSDDHVEVVIIGDLSGDNINGNKIQSEAVSPSYEKDNSTSDYVVLQKSGDIVEDVIIQDFSVDNNIEAKTQVSEAVSLCDQKNATTKDTEILPESDDHLEGIIIEDFHGYNINENENQSKAVSPSGEKDKSKSDSVVLHKSDDHLKDVIEDFPVGKNIEARIEVTEVYSLGDGKDKSTYDTEILPKSDDHLEGVIIEDIPDDNTDENENQFNAISSSYEKNYSTRDYEVLKKSDDNAEDAIIEDFSIGDNIEAEIQVSEAVPLCDEKGEITKDTEILPKSDDHSDCVIIDDTHGDNINENEIRSEDVSPSFEQDKSTSDSEALQKSDDNVKDVIKDFSVGNNIEARIQVTETVSLCDEKDKTTKDTEILPKSDDYSDSVIIEDIHGDNINENEIRSEDVSPSFEQDKSTSDSEALQKSDDNVKDVIKDFSVGNIIENKIQVSDAVPSSEKDESSASEILPNPDGNSEYVIHENLDISRTNENLEISEVISLRNENDKLSSDSETLQKLDEKSEEIINQNLDIIQKVQISESDQKDKSKSDSQMLPKSNIHLKNVINENFAVDNIIKTDRQISEVIFVSKEKDKLPSDTELILTPDDFPDLSKTNYSKEPTIQNIVGMEDDVSEKFYIKAKEDMLEDSKYEECSLVDESKNFPLKELTVETSSEQRFGIEQISMPKKSVDQAIEIIKLPNNKRKYLERQEETDTFTVSEKSITQMIPIKKGKLSENETILEIFSQSGEKLSLNESEPEGNKQYVLQVPPSFSQKTVENFKNDLSNPIEYQETIQATEYPPSYSIHSRTEREIALNEDILITKENSSHNYKLLIYKNFDSEAENTMQDSDIEIQEIQSSKIELSCNLTEEKNINTFHSQENNSSNEITKYHEYVEVTKEPEHALNLSFHKNEVNSTEGKISVEEQSIKPLISSVYQETPEIQSLNPSKNELSFSIERMLQPSSKNQQKKYCDNLQSITKIETSSEEQVNKGIVCTNVISDTFKHPRLLNYDNLGIKKNKSITKSEMEEIKKINKKEKPYSTSKVEENQKVIVERVYSMDELAVGTPISPCLNICSAPILPISTEFIPYRYGIYNTVIPAERSVADDSCFHSGNDGSSNKKTSNLDARIQTETVYEEKHTIKETPILDKEIKSTIDTIKIAGTKVLKPECNTLLATPSKSENDIEIVQVEGQNYIRSEIQKFGHSLNIQKLENKCGNLDQVALNMGKPISPNQNNTNLQTGDVHKSQNSSLSFIPYENKADQVKQFDTIIKKTENDKNISSSSESIDNANISDDHCSSDVFKSEINKNTKESRKCIKSILNCTKSKELFGKPKNHSNYQNSHLDEFKGLHTNIKKSTNILNKSFSLEPLNEINPFSKSVKLNESSENQTFIENINQQRNISAESSTSSTFNMERVVADTKTVGSSKYPSDSILESHKIETTKANFPATEVSSLFNSNMEQPELPDGFVNKVVVQSSGTEGMESFLTNFQSSITIAQNISSFQGSFSLFSDNSDNRQEILPVNFQEKTILPINQPEVFINSTLNLTQSTPIRPQETSQADDSIFNMSDDIFDFDFNNVNQTATGSTYSNSFVNATMSSENLQMIFDNPEFLHLLYNFNDVGCEVTVDNTNVEDMVAKPAEYIASELIQQQLDAIPPFIAEEEFDSNAPTDPMVGGQKELVPDPKQDSTLDEVPFPESALSFDEEMMHHYASFLHCDVNSTGQSSAADQSNQTKNLEEPVENSVVQSGSKQKPEYALIDQKTSNSHVEKIIQSEEKSLADSSELNIKDNHSTTPPMTQETTNIVPNAQETIRGVGNSSLKTLSPNSSSECNKSSNKTMGKNPVKVQKIPASKYAPPKKQRNHDTHQNKKTQEKAESKLSKTSNDEKGNNLTLDLEYNNSLDMPQLFSPNETSYKSKSLPSIHNRSKADSKTCKSEGQSIKKSEKPLEDDSGQQMQYNMYDRTKAMKRNAAMRENYCKFFDDGSSTSKNKKRKISIKAEPGNNSNSSNVIEKTSEKRNSLNRYESQTKKIKIEDDSKHEKCKTEHVGSITHLYESQTEKIKFDDDFKHETCKTEHVGSIPLGVKHPHVVRDLNAEFDKLKNSGPYKSSGPKNIKYTRTDRILRSAQEASSSHYQASTSAQHNYAERGKREDRGKRENTECYRKSEDLKRKTKVPERSRSPHSRSSAYTSTSSDYRRENFRRSKPLETKRNDGWYERESYQPSDERRRTFEGHHSRDLHRKMDRSYKPSSSRPPSSQSQQKSESKNGEEWFKKLDELWPLERNVYQSTGH